MGTNKRYPHMPMQRPGRVAKGAGEPGRPGRRLSDARMMLEGIIYRCRCGTAWRDLQEDGSNYTNPGVEQPGHGIGHSRGGLLTKIHQLIDGNGLPLVTVITRAGGWLPVHRVPSFLEERNECQADRTDGTTAIVPLSDGADETAVPGLLSGL